MNIGFDVSDLCTNRADGTTRYTRELAKRLPATASNDTWMYFAPCEKSSTYQVLSSKYPVQWIASPWPKWWTQSRLPIDLYRYRPEVLFMPIQQIPFLRPGGMKTIAVVHDLAFHIYPDHFTYKDWLLQHVFTAYTVRTADRLIAVSGSTAHDIEKYYGRTKNVHVIHHGLDHAAFHLPSESEREHSGKILLKQYPQLRKPYLLYVGQIQPRKNLIRLIEAFEQLRKSDSELQLVIAGSHGWLQQPILNRIQESPERKHILLPGRVDEELLRWLYWHAEVFVLPSLYEGFGMPVLEAFASGCPVVTSNVSSLPEVAGEAAVLVDPLSVASLRVGIQEARRRAKELRERGIARAKEFSWDVTATQVREVLDSLS